MFGKKNHKILSGRLNTQIVIAFISSVETDSIFFIYNEDHSDKYIAFLRAASINHGWPENPFQYMHLDTAFLSLGEVFLIGHTDYSRRIGICVVLHIYQKVHEILILLDLPLRICK